MKMTNVIKCLVLMLLCMCTSIVTSIAQVIDSTAVSTGGSPTPDVVLMFFGTIPGMITLSMIVTGWLTIRISALKNANSIIKQILSWMVVICVCIFGYLKGYGTWGDGGLLHTANTWVAIGYSIGIAAVANKLFDDGTLNDILILTGSGQKRIR